MGYRPWHGQGDERLGLGCRIGEHAREEDVANGEMIVMGGRFQSSLL